VTTQTIKQWLMGIKPSKQERKYGYEDPPAGLGSWLVPFQYPIEFFRGGLKAAYNRKVPYAVDEKYRDNYGASLASYLRHYSEKSFLRKVRWMGVNALKQVSDLWVYQEILYETKPEVIVEIGSHKGGSTLFLAHMLDILGKGEVVSIDLSHGLFEPRHPRIITLTGDCSSPEIFARARERTKGKSTMVIHDGDHSWKSVFRDMILYEPLVTPGNYFIVEDGHVDVLNSARVRVSDVSSGPVRAIDKFLKTHPGVFEIDAEKERFILTFNPKGYLRKVKR